MATSMAQLSVSASILGGEFDSGDLKKRLTTEEGRGQKEHSRDLDCKADRVHDLLLQSQQRPRCSVGPGRSIES